MAPVISKPHSHPEAAAPAGPVIDAALGRSLAPRADTAPDRVSSSDDYHRRFRGRSGDYLLSVQTRGLLSLIEPLGKELRILDIGGGHAQSALPLAKAGHHVTILNSHAEYELRARRECEGQDIEFLSGPLDAPPVDPGSYDLVMALRIVMHMPDWRSFVRSMCQAAGRAVLVDYPSWRSSNILEPLLFDLKRRVEGGTTRKYQLFWPREVREAFLASGFEHRASFAECFLPLVVHRMAHAPAVTGAIESLARGLGLTGYFGSPVLTLAVRG
ncbi:MAG: methyltransferase domain-containing protein [Planctomycetota bacterium]